MIFVVAIGSLLLFAKVFFNKIFRKTEGKKQVQENIKAGNDLQRELDISNQNKKHVEEKMNDLVEENKQIEDYRETIRTQKQIISENAEKIKELNPKINPVEKNQEDSLVQVEEKQFDMVIDINSILKFNQISWVFSVRKDSPIVDIIKNDTQLKSRCFIVIGPFNSGKTFLMHLLYGIKLPELGVASRTKSFSALYIDDTYPILVVDTAGIFSPCSYSNDFEQEISDMEATEHLLGEVSCKIADYVILVVQDLAWPIQKYISRVRKSLGPNSTLIMIHNWRDAKTEKEMDFLIKEQLIKVFNSEEQAQADKGTYYFTKKTRELSEIRHLCLLDNRSEFGEKENLKKTDLLRTWINHLSAVQHQTNFVKAFTSETLGIEIDFSKEENLKFKAIEGTTPKIQSILRSFDVNKISLKCGENSNNIDSHKPLVEILYNDSGPLSINKEKFYNDSQFKIREYFVKNDNFLIRDVQIPDCSYGFIINSSSELKHLTVEELCEDIGSYVPSMFVLEVRDRGRELKLTVKRVRENCKICDTFPTDSENYGSVFQIFDLDNNDQRYIFEDAFCENGSLRIIASKCDTRGDRQDSLYKDGEELFRQGFKQLDIISTKEQFAALQEIVIQRKEEISNATEEKLLETDTKTLDRDEVN